MSQRRKLKRGFRPVAVTNGEAHVYINGVVHNRSIDGEETVSLASFREQLARCKGATVINVHINSPGGIVTEGMAIYAALRACSARKVGIVEGIAASIASVILMGCDERRVAKGSFVMIHDPYKPGYGGRASDLRKAADELDQLQGEMLDIYESRTGIERSKLEKMLAEETYFTAEEAVEAGLADEVEGALEAKIDARAVARLDPKKVPAALSACAAKGKAKAMKGKNAKMKALEEELARLKAMAAEEDDDEPAEDEEEETEEETEDTEEDHHNESDDDSQALVATVFALTGTKDAASATAKIASMISSGASGAATNRKAAVEAAIKAGKLIPALRGVALKWSDRSWREFVKSIGGEAMLKLGRTHAPPADATEQTQRRPGSAAEDIIARQFKVDINKIKGELPACARKPGKEA